MTKAGDIDIAVEFLRDHLRRPVVLVGMMGSGKTSIGRKLADRLDMDFYDSDKLVEEKAGATIPEIFESYGEEKFRQAERNSILEILAQGPCVLATGGGAVIHHETRKAIKSKAVSVWLKAEVEELVRRVGQAADRPLLKKGDSERTLKELMVQREPFYAETDIHIQSHSENPEKTLEMLINSLYGHLKTDRV